MIKGRASLGQIGTYAGLDEISIAYVVIPEDFDRAGFIQQCYRTSTLMLRNESGSTYRNVFASVGVMQAVVFPEDSTKRGSVVVCCKIPVHNIPIAIDVVDLKNAVGLIQEEAQARIQKRFDANLVDFDMRAQRSEVVLSVSSAVDGQGTLRMNLTNPDRTCKYLVDIRGEFDGFADNIYRLGSNKQLLFDIINDSNQQIAKLHYEVGEGWTLLDEYKNEVVLKDGEIHAKVNDGKSVYITKQKVNISAESPNETAVLGKELKDTLGKLIDAINQITVPTAYGPSGIPNNSAAFTAIKNTLDTILSKIVFLE